MPARPRRLILAALPAVLLLVACGGNQDGAFSRYLQADARPNDPSARVQFGRGKLPSDFPAGLPTLPHASLLGWARTESDTARSWEAVYEAPGDAGATLNSIIDGLKAGGWQITDRSDRQGFHSLNITGSGASQGPTGVIAVGPAVQSGRVQVVEEIGQDK